MNARPVLARLAAAALGVVVALAVLELVVRLAVPPSASEVLRGLHVARPEKPWLYGLKPHARRRDATHPDVVYQVNAEGFRDRAFGRAPASDALRILVLGDSIAFGYGVALEQTFAKQLERRLRAAAEAPSFEVLNLGVSGYNPYTEAALLADVGLGYRPDVVLAQFCVNDLNDPTLHFDASTMLALGDIPEAAFPDGAAHRRPAPPAGDVLRRACRSSRLCTLLADRLAPPLDDETMVRALSPRSDPSAAEVAWLEEQYERMARAAAERGARLVLVVFPYESQLAPGGPDALQRAMVTLGQRTGVPVIDLLPAFRRAAADGGEPLFLDLWHPSARGHEVAAEAIYRELACRGLLPGLEARCAAP